MDGKLRPLTGLAATVLCLARLDRILITAEGVVDWRLVAIAAFVAGAAVTRATARRSPLPRLGWHGIGLLAILLRVTVPDSLAYGVIPTGSAMGDLAVQLGNAIDTLRYGVPPVVALPGLIALVALAMWLLGHFVAGSGESPPRIPAATLAPLGLYLYLSLVDREPASPGWTLAVASIVTLALLAHRPDHRRPGRLRDEARRPLPRVDPVAVTAAALAVVVFGVATPSTVEGLVPATGAVNWRNQGGEGRPGTGSGVAATRFVDLRQDILSLSDDPVFVAEVAPLEAVIGPLSYWRLITLDEYDGEVWQVAGRRGPALPETATRPVTQTIRIESLRDDRLPSLARPRVVASDEPLVRSGSLIGPDNTLLLDGFTFPGLTYRVESEVPLIDPGSVPNRWLVDPGPSLDGFLALPDEVDPRLGALVAQLVGDASPLEAALRLEDFLRKMSYNTRVTTGQSSLDLADWLVDPSSPNYRTGYCEQFAAAMGVLARLAGLPARLVIGYTTGDRTEGQEGTLLVVRERHAHAWVEVWIEGPGWVPFDPTPRADGATASLATQLDLEVMPPPGSADPGFSPPVLPPGFEDIGPTPPVPPSAPSIPTAGSAPIWVVLIVLALAATVGSVPSFKAHRRRRRLRRLREGDVDAAWREIVDRLDDLGDGPQPYETPLEYGHRQAPEIEALARSFSAARYGGKDPGDTWGRFQAAEAWVERTHPPARRWKAAVSPRSLRRG